MRPHDLGQQILAAQKIIQEARKKGVELLIHRDVLLTRK